MVSPASVNTRVMPALRPTTPIAIACASMCAAHRAEGTTGEGARGIALTAWTLEWSWDLPPQPRPIEGARSIVALRYWLQVAFGACSETLHGLRGPGSGPGPLDHYSCP